MSVERARTTLLIASAVGLITLVINIIAGGIITSAFLKSVINSILAGSIYLTVTFIIDRFLPEIKDALMQESKEKGVEVVENEGYSQEEMQELYNPTPTENVESSPKPTEDNTPFEPTDFSKVGSIGTSDTKKTGFREGIEENEEVPIGGRGSRIDEEISPIEIARRSSFSTGELGVTKITPPSDIQITEDYIISRGKAIPKDPEKIAKAIETLLKKEE